MGDIVTVREMLEQTMQKFKEVKKKNRLSGSKRLKIVILVFCT